jgi:predicted dehydrogenase
MTDSLNRRHFLQASSCAVAAGSLAALAAKTARAAGANEKVVIGIMGVNGRGKALAGTFASQPDVQIAYLCDVDENVVGPCVKLVEAKQKKAPQVVDDFRRVLDDQSVDGLVIAAPDHWHALATIHACQAGKHVYVEKPVSHNVVEGRRMIEAARKHNRVVQAGTQRRSSEALAGMVEYLQSGQAGKLHFARSWITSKRPNIGYAKDTMKPPGVNYDLWLGPAPSRPFNPNHFHYKWHWNWLYGTGELGNNGVHGLDLARWGLGVGAPDSVVSSGGKHFFDDDQVTPDTQIACFEYPGLTLVWEHRTWSPRGIDGLSFGVEFHGEKAVVVTDGKTWSIERPKGEKTAGPKADIATEPRHQRNWLDCIRTAARPNADIEIGHGSTMLCHLGNISQRVGRKLKWDAATERFADDAEANALLARAYRAPWTLPTV